MAVYFDAGADAMDGKGWTVDDGGAVVVRYATEAEANKADQGWKAHDAARAALEASKIIEGYNGWRNYPTWCVNLWLSNDESLYIQTQSRASLARADALRDAHAFDASDRGQTRLWSVADAAKSKLARVLKDWVTDELAPDLGATFAADLLGYALGEVDWYEIAGAWLEGEA